LSGGGVRERLAGVGDVGRQGSLIRVGIEVTTADDVLAVTFSGPSRYGM
jgi:hypothetical protein